MRIFLDIGGHNGETLAVVLRPEHRFDRVYTFEPAPRCWPLLDAKQNGKLEVCRFGLWHEDAVLELHNAGHVGASVAADKDAVESSTPCEFRDAAQWFAEHVSDDDEVFAKINVEGAEYEVVKRLDDAGELGKIDHLLIHMDVRKSPSRAHLATEIGERLDRSRIEYLSADQIVFGGVLRGTRNWLRWCESNPRTRDLRFRRAKAIEQRGRNALYPLKGKLLRARASSR